MNFSKRLAQAVLACCIALGLGSTVSQAGVSWTPPPESPESPEFSELLDLCEATTACTYAPPTAPQLHAEVCWDQRTARVVLADINGCEQDTEAMNLQYGEVIDDDTLEVAAYLPLQDACELGYCVQGPSTAVEDEMCCTANGCTPYSGGACAGEIVFCFDMSGNGCNGGE